MGIVYCDLDGTLIEGDLEREFLKYLRNNNYLKICNYIGAFLSIPLNYIRRKKNRGSLLKSWTIGFKQEQLQYLFYDFFRSSNPKLKNIPQTWQLLMQLKKDCKIVLLTGSYEELVSSFLKYKKIDSFFDRIIGCQVKSNGYTVKMHPYGIDKCSYITEEKDTIGIANEFADSFYLSHCDEVYILPGDLRLEKIAEINNWRRL